MILYVGIVLHVVGDEDVHQQGGPHQEQQTDQQVNYKLLKKRLVSFVKNI